MENQHLIIKLNEAEKYLTSSEYEIRQQLQNILKDIKVRDKLTKSSKVHTTDSSFPPISLKQSYAFLSFKILNAQNAMLP